MPFGFYNNLMTNQYVMQLLLPQTVPYIYTIPGGLRAGVALYFQGVILATGQTYVFILVITRHRQCFSGTEACI